MTATFARAALPRRGGPALALAVLFVVAAALEIARIVTDSPWPGIRPLHSHVTSAVLGALWTSAASINLLRRQKLSLARVAGVLAILGTLGMVAHALFASFHGGRLALLYLPAAALAGFLCKRTLDRGAVDHLSPEAPSERATRGLG